jgi:hypothetical protein
MGRMREFDPTQRRFVSYIDKSREYYLAQGFANPYRWACFDGVPFRPLRKPLANCRVGLVTTAAASPPPGEVGPRRRKSVYAAPTTPPPVGLYTDDLFWDHEATHTDDRESYLPIDRLREAAATGHIGAASPRFYGVPTEFSQRRTLSEDAPAVARLCRADRLDAVVLVPL